MYSSNLSLSYLQPNQAQKHVTVNDRFRQFDIVVQLAVVSDVAIAQPVSPEEGARYILRQVLPAMIGPGWKSAPLLPFRMGPGRSMCQGQVGLPGMHKASVFRSSAVMHGVILRAEFRTRSACSVSTRSQVRGRVSA